MHGNSGINKVFLVGHVEATPKKHMYGNGDHRLLFVLSTKEEIRKGNELTVHTEYHNLYIDAEHHDLKGIELVKGCMLHVAGKIQTKMSVGFDGVKRYKCEIQVLQLTMLQLPVEALV